MEFTEEQQQEINQLIVQEKAKWENEILSPLQQQVNELGKYKPADKTDKEKEIEAKEKELWQKEKELTLKGNSLYEFAEFFSAQNADELHKQIEQLNKILQSKKLNNTYVPENHKPADAYSKAEKQGDTVTMIGTKLSKIFK